MNGSLPFGLTLGASEMLAAARIAGAAGTGIAATGTVQLLLVQERWLLYQELC